MYPVCTCMWVWLGSHSARCKNSLRTRPLEVYVKIAPEESGKPLKLSLSRPNMNWLMARFGEIGCSLRHIGFVATYWDLCVFVLLSRIHFVILYVDDITNASGNHGLLHRVKWQLMMENGEVHSRRYQGTGKNGRWQFRKASTSGPCLKRMTCWIAIRPTFQDRPKSCQLTSMKVSCLIKIRSVDIKYRRKRYSILSWWRATALPSLWTNYHKHAASRSSLI